MDGFPPLSRTLNSQCLMSLLRSVSSILRPMRCLASKTVLAGLEWNAFLAESPTNHSSSVKLTHEGVIWWPWLLAIILTRPPRCTRAKEAVPTLGKRDKNFIWTLTLCFICLYETGHRWDDKCYEWKRRCHGAPWLCTVRFNIFSRRFSNSLIPITLPYWQSWFPFSRLPYDTGHLQMRVLNSTMRERCDRMHAVINERGLVIEVTR